MSSFFQAKLPIFRPRRSTHDLSHGNHLSSDLGKLTPFFCTRTEFGDKWRMSVVAQGRTMPLWTPVMDRLKTKFAFYNVTIRSIWDGFEDFITSGGKWSLDGELPPEIPQCTVKALQELYFEVALSDGLVVEERDLPWKGSLLDYLDYPYHSWDSPSSVVAETLPVTVLPLIAMGYIYQQRFLNQNIQAVMDLREIRKLRGDLTTWSEAQRVAFARWTNYGRLFDVNWNKDYLTAAQPFTQKGKDVILPLDVTLPDGIQLHSTATSRYGLAIGDDGKVTFVQQAVTNARTATWTYINGGATVPVNQRVIAFGTVTSQNDAATGDVRTLLVKDSPFDELIPENKPRSVSNPEPDIYFNLRDSEGNPVTVESSITINELRMRSALQRILEQAAVGGTRYVEYALHQFGIRISDRTAQIPQFLGGTSIPIQIGEVIQTSATEGSGADQSVLGRYAGTGYQRGGAAPARCYCEEASYLLGIQWTKPQTTYMWGVPRHLAELDVFDFLNPHFAHLGEQEVYNYEAMRDPDDPRGTFGYLMRYDHLRTSLSRVHGEFRDTLTDWHMARNNVQVALNSDFVTAKPTKRIFNFTGSGDCLLHELWINIKVKRSIPKRANPLLK